MGLKAPQRSQTTSQIMQPKTTSGGQDKVKDALRHLARQQNVYQLLKRLVHTEKHHESVACARSNRGFFYAPARHSRQAGTSKRLSVKPARQNVYQFALSNLNLTAASVLNEIDHSILLNNW